MGGCLTLGVVAVTFFSAPQLRRFGFEEEETEAAEA